MEQHEDEQPATMAVEAAPTTGIPAVGDVEGGPTAYSEEPEIGEWVGAAASRRRMVALVASILVVTGGAAAVILLFGRHPQYDAGPTKPAAGVQSSVGSSWPTDPADKQFVTILNTQGVKVSNQRIYAQRARDLCKILIEADWAPGTHTFENAKQVVAHDESTWDDVKLSSYTGAMFNAYCPQLWGPTEQQIAEMAPDRRYVAMLADELGASTADSEVAHNVETAHTYCAELDAGDSYDWIVDQISSSSDGVDHEMARTVLDIATQVYCPAHSR